MVTNLETAYLLCSHTQDQDISSHCGVMTHLYASQFSFPLGLYFKYLTILVPPAPTVCLEFVPDFPDEVMQF